MTPEEWAQNLLARGYSFCGRHRDKTKDPEYSLTCGDRVRVNNMRGKIEEIYYKERPRAAQIVQSDDVELIVRMDNGTYSFVASHHVSKIE